ncbi:IS630 family transposase [Pseudonocardia kunmingensis]|uniref:Transposase n=1 Tax=Pseudonocardia kunmingensis TaxID=630975 RepID=A0A543DNY6_9PSEU|nr:IS630 family transposase [Pseudonocardia kunmingensis]TQM11044.1 transposase [Pseudonocardia kunmingensis]
MRDNDGRKLDHATLEALRIRACEQIENGAHPEDVAAGLGFNRSTVFGWVAAYRKGGAEALRAKPVPGRPPKLTRAQMSVLFTMIAGSNPAQFQLEFALWTRDLVRQVIAQRFGVNLSVGSVGRVLRSLGLSPQRPLHRATQQDPERVARWRAEEYPAIRDEAAQLGATVYFADEAGIRSDCHSGTTWAPVGQTPVVRTTGARHAINMISAVTAKGAMHFRTFTGKMNADVFIDYCRDLLNDDGGTVFLIIDGHPVHRSRAVKDFAASTEGRPRLFFLPPYSPELNPDEWVWKNVKHDRIGKTAISSADDLRGKAESALLRLQRLPELIRAFFRDPCLRYITA